MFTHVLDTSAWLIHLLDEPGAAEISGLFKSRENRVAVSALSLVEVYVRFKLLGRAERFPIIYERYELLFREIIPTTEEIALRAIELRSATKSRIPAIDSLIAATAAHHNAILVHRDPHFLPIAAESLQQLHLG